MQTITTVALCPETVTQLKNLGVNNLSAFVQSSLDAWHNAGLRPQPTKTKKKPYCVGVNKITLDAVKQKITGVTSLSELVNQFAQNYIAEKSRPRV